MGVVIDKGNRYWLEKDWVYEWVFFPKHVFYLPAFIIPQVAFDFCERQRKNQKFRDSLEFKLLGRLVVRATEEKEFS